ncbi:hypothetical protein C8F01DRAFT_1249751 [Mycena amicta]|nr:hypothetical protein C8F01DRAFT_1249751 [Mycena amicta]
MLTRLAGELIPAAKCPSTFSEALESLCNNTHVLASGARKDDLRAVFHQLLKPCLTAKTSVQVDVSKPTRVRFHDHARLVIPDYFAGLGYILSMQAYDSQNLVQRIRLLALYAKVCKLSATHVNSRPPTTVQLLWVDTPKDPRLVLGSSLAWFKARNHFQQARSVRAGILHDLWDAPGALIHPTPDAVSVPEPCRLLVRDLLGRLRRGNLAFRTLETSLFTYTIEDAGGRSASDWLLEHSSIRDLQETFNILTRANALRSIYITPADILADLKELERNLSFITSSNKPYARREGWMTLRIFNVKMENKKQYQDYLEEPNGLTEDLDIAMEEEELSA